VEAAISAVFGQLLLPGALGSVFQNEQIVLAGVRIRPGRGAEKWCNSYPFLNITPGGLGCKARPFKIMNIGFAAQLYP
jgi:hypothetical protein